MAFKKKKIIIATGIYPPDIGGPAIYAKKIKECLENKKINVKVIKYGIEKNLPLGIRHFIFFLKTLFNIKNTDLIIAFDTFSVGFPSVCVALLFKKKIIIRVGGDFLWESYIQRTNDKVLLSEFYKRKDVVLSLKEKIIYNITSFVLRNSSAVVFTSEWQKNIFKNAYNIKKDNFYIIENYCNKKKRGPIKYSSKNNIKVFLWAGRNINIKNLDLLKDAFCELEKHNKNIKLKIIPRVGHNKLKKEIKNSYAVILPSLSDITPNFILDAISLNKPFILTKETGFYDKLRDLGVFVNPLDKEDIKNKVLFLSDEKNYTKHLTLISKFEFLHSWDQIADEFLTLYKKI